MFWRIIYVRSVNFRIKRWVKRNERGLTFLGAFILFATFVVKDGIGDKVRNNVESVKTALSVYQIRNDSQLTQSEMSHTNDQLIDFAEEKVSASAETLFSANGLFVSETGKVNDSLSRVYHSLDNLSDFLV